MYASANGHTDAIKFLIASGAKLETRDKFIFTALMIASTQGETEAIKVLLDAGAELNAKDKFGKTALDKARQCGHTDAAKLLESPQQHAQAAAQTATALGKRRADDDEDDGEDEEGEESDEEGEEDEGDKPKAKMPRTGSSGSGVPLKPGWREVVGEDGEPYYWNDELEEAVWEPPRAD